MSTSENPKHQRMEPRKEQERRLRASALALKQLYEAGGELTEWTSLDGEDFLEVQQESDFQNQNEIQRGIHANP
jgi:hypothetical protein